MIWIQLRIKPPNIAFRRATRGPAAVNYYLPLTASTPPVMNPAAIWFNGLYLRLISVNAQSVSENIPPHNAKLPPKIGARFASSLKPPMSRSLFGARYMPWLATVSTLAKIPDDTRHAPHGKGTTKIVNNSVGAGLFASSHNYFIIWWINNNIYDQKEHKKIRALYVQFF
jgi:hypothetical protein